MRISKTEAYNNTSFGAKVYILGNKETIPKNIIPKIEYQAKRIGKGEDSIVFYFGKPMLDVLHAPNGRILQQSRNIFARSIINNVKRAEKDLSYNIFNDDLKDTRMILDSVYEYLNNLKRSL